MKKLLSVNADYKTTKGLKQGYLTGILYMMPQYTSDNETINLCPFASSGCKQACLVSAGRGSFSNVKQSRLNKSRLWLNDKNQFFTILVKDIKALIRKANRENLTPVVRLNGTSDISWENYKFENKTIFEHFPNVQFYDYTKNYTRDVSNIKNYHLTLSRSEGNENRVLAHINKHNVAIVFNTLPKQYRGYPVVNGDDTDLRFLDDKNVIVGLTAKGKAKKDTSGFTVRV